ncbi:MAG: hypothetical protein V7637_5493, partial [Mycobacteriales bacterium]
HGIAILSVAPELRSVLPVPQETLTALAVPTEHTRFFAGQRTLRIAHGLAEFLRDHLRRLGTGPRSLLIDAAEHADGTDQELLAVLLRRLDPALLTLAVGTAAEPGAGLAAALRRHAVRLTPPARPARPRPAGVVDAVTLARRYVASDGTSDESRLRAAYLGLEPAHRARLHDERAADLECRDELSLLLGAVPYHHERGSTGAGARALRFAQGYCLDHGFYEATVDCGIRGRRIVDWSSRPALWWAYTSAMAAALTELGRAQEAEDLYDDARATCTAPAIHLQAAYATAMLYTRQHAAGRRDPRRAKAWLNTAIALAAMLPDPQERAYQTVLQQDALALIEVQLGNLPAALRLVDSGLARLDKDLDPAEQRPRRSVLRYHRAQVYAGLGRLDEALADYTAVIDADPEHAGYYAERGSILRQLGEHDAALADYARAAALSPPDPEVVRDRAGLRLDRGELPAARADLDYLLELDPGHLAALIDRAGLLCRLGERAAARRDVGAGLELAPGDPELHCLLGRLEAAAGDPDAARAAFTTALTADPTLQVAWANRATVAFETGDIPAALDDLSRALAIADDADLRINRASAYQAAGDLDSAIIDLARARDLGAPQADDLLAALPAPARH